MTAAPFCPPGRHRAVALTSDAAGDHGRCRTCGSALLRSPITRRWRLTGLLG